MANTLFGIYSHRYLTSRYCVLSIIIIGIMHYTCTNWNFSFHFENKLLFFFLRARYNESKVIERTCLQPTKLKNHAEAAGLVLVLRGTMVSD